MLESDCTPSRISPFSIRFPADFRRGYVGHIEVTRKLKWPYAQHRPSSNDVKEVNGIPTNIGACITGKSTHNINPTDEPNVPFIYAAISAKCCDDGQALP
jgi:hypothetical protein